MPTTAGSSLVESTLRELGFDKIKRQGRGFMACCRFHDDSNPSFSINDQGLWQCFGCGEKGNFKTLHDKLGGSVDWRTACQILGIALQDKREFARKPTSKRVHLPEGFNVYNFVEEVPDMIAKRVIWDTVRKFKLGRASGWQFENRCVIPIFFRGNDVGYHARDVTGKAERKYLNPTDFDIKDYLFNFDGCTPGEELIITEGAFSCMSMVEKGFTNTVATFGTQWTPAQVRRIFELDPVSVVICFDRDNKKRGVCPGQKAAMKLGAVLSQMLNVSIMPLPTGVDPNDAPADVLKKCYDRRVKYETLLAGNKNGS